MNSYIKTLNLFAIGFLCVAAVACSSAAQYHEDDSWEERHNAYQPPDRVMDAIGVKEGMVVAEVGAGRGRYVVHMAARVGSGGLVYANDIDEKKLEYLRHRCQRDSISNVSTILGKVDDPMLPEGKMDVVYVINTYHHLDEPEVLMRNILPSLKQDGVLVIIEHDPDKYPDAGPNHSTPHVQLLKEAQQAGFELLRREDFLERDYINIFRPIGRTVD